jgi:hypothetical protein
MICAGRLRGQQQGDQAQGHDHAKMMERGEKGMGFSQTATTHHFLLAKDGGTIQVTANDAKDTATRDEIRMHLQHIAHLFSTGDFDIPMFIHDQVAPGVPEMKKLKGEIHYEYAEIANGGKVVISSSNPAAVAAVQKFLRFQIEEHQTPDPREVN